MIAGGAAATMAASPRAARSACVYLSLVATAAYSQEYVTVGPSDTTLPATAPPFTHSTQHPQVPRNVSASLDVRPSRLQTNGFYTNWLLDAPEKMAWTLPYVVLVNHEPPYGLAASHPRFYDGTKTEDGRLSWYSNSAVKDIILSFAEYGTSEMEVSLTAADSIGLGAEFRFTDEGRGGRSMRANLVRGMAYVTVVYEALTTPIVSSVHAFLTVNGKSAANGTHSSTDGVFKLKLNDGSTWCLFVGSHETAGNISFQFKPLSLEGPNRLEAIGAVAAGTTFRVAKIPYHAVQEKQAYEENLEILQTHAAVFPTGADLKAEVGLPPNDDEGRITFSWRVEGVPGGGGNESVPLLHFALPHHQERLDPSKRTGMLLASPTKGKMELVVGNEWVMVEDNLPELSWVPDTAHMGEEQRLWIEYHLEKDVAAGNSTLGDAHGASIYFGSKRLMAYAQVCLIANKLGRWNTREDCLDRVAPVLARYINGTNGNPLVYDEVWGGIIGRNGLIPGEESSDFYSAYYNDHHFHYSYIINAAAVMAELRPNWATPAKIDWVNTLVRDVNNPSLEDPYFPAFRSFDWYCGHSWARGLLFAYDGKDQESTSEDVNFYYAMAMWGKATGNEDMSRLGRLQLGVLARTISTYFLMTNDNVVHPAAFVRNKVTGILFEMKVDYTTWFGTNPEYIHGIQNIPVTAATDKIRLPKFVREEWDQRLAGVVDVASGTWKTVLLMSYATIEKHLAFIAMLSSGMDEGLLRTWALFWAATRPPCDNYCTHQQVTLPTVSASLPKGNGGQPWPLPGTVQAEDFDLGGANISYYDLDPENRGGAYRETEGVDIQGRIPAADGYYLAWIQSREWTQYSVIATVEGNYTFTFDVAAPWGLGSFRVVTGGHDCGYPSLDLTGTVNLNSTGSFGGFVPLQIEHVRLEAGRQQLRFCALVGGFSIDSFMAQLDTPN